MVRVSSLVPSPSPREGTSFFFARLARDQPAVAAEATEAHRGLVENECTPQKAASFRKLLCDIRMLVVPPFSTHVALRSQKGGGVHLGDAAAVNATPTGETNEFGAHLHDSMIHVRELTKTYADLPGTVRGPVWAEF